MKIYLIRRRHLILFAGILVAFAMFWVVNVPDSVAASVATRQLPIYCVDRDDKMISISFDAAWGNEVMDGKVEVNTSTIKKGDVNGDGVVNGRDTITIATAIANKTTDEL